MGGLEASVLHCQEGTQANWAAGLLSQYHYFVPLDHAPVTFQKCHANMLLLLLIPIAFTTEVLQVSQLSPSFLEFCLEKLIVSLTFCQLFLGLFSYVRGGNSPHILVHRW